MPDASWNAEWAARHEWEDAKWALRPGAVAEYMATLNHWTPSSRTAHLAKAFPSFPGNWAKL